MRADVSGNSPLFYGLFSIAKHLAFVLSPQLACYISELVKTRARRHEL